MPADRSKQPRRTRWAPMLMVAVGALHMQPVAAQWTEGDTLREAGYDTLLLIDDQQTRQAMALGYRELNPMLGPQPSPRQIDRHMLVFAMLHAGVSALLPPLSRHVWQWGTSAGEAVVVAHNTIYVHLSVRF